MTPHSLPDLAIEDLVLMSTVFSDKLSSLDPPTLSIAWDAISGLMHDICFYAIAVEQRHLAEAISENPELAILGESLMKPDVYIGMVKMEGLSIDFTVENGKIVLLDICRICHG